MLSKREATKTKSKGKKNRKKKEPKQLKLIRCVVRCYERRFYWAWCEKEEWLEPVIANILKSENAGLFEYLTGSFVYVGGSDRVNLKLWKAVKPRPTFHRIKDQLKRARCPRLGTFDDFHGCGYSKYLRTCGEPEYFPECPLPKYFMRFGRINQMVFSVYLFLRDRCRNDFPGFVKSFFGSPKQLARLSEEDLRDKLKLFVKEMTRLHMVGPKLVNMAVADVFCVTAKDWNYLRVFHRMVAVDTLIHEFLHRSGTLKAFGKEHNYGAACHKEHGCLGVIEEVARQIDCSRYNEEYPAYFPKLVQSCLWRFCTESCNLNACRRNAVNVECEFRDWCDRLPASRPPGK
jgi:hypothetical protein